LAGRRGSGEHRRRSWKTSDADGPAAGRSLWSAILVAGRCPDDGVADWVIGMGNDLVLAISAATG
jgi:hypothetical protein